MKNRFGQRLSDTYKENSNQVDKQSTGVLSIGILVLLAQLFFGATVSLRGITDWQTVLLNLYERCLEFQICYCAILFLPVRSKQVKTIISLALSIILGSVVSFDFQFCYQSKDMWKLVFVAVIFILLCLNLFLKDRIIAKIQTVSSPEKQRSLLHLYRIFLVVLLFLFIASGVLHLILIYKKTGFRVVPIRW